ncbi:hypothetical protein DXT91_17030 [Agrobacterium tumefaciens]|nr:hypothetical protein [Agrobacterium tumefaciens]
MRSFTPFSSPSFLCSSQESSRRASARGDNPFSPRTWADWIPVTSTGMRVWGRCGASIAVDLPCPGFYPPHPHQPFPKTVAIAFASGKSNLTKGKLR